MKSLPVIGRAIETSALYRMMGSSVCALRYRLHHWLAPPSAPRPRAAAPTDNEFKHISFIFAIIALSARVACADGALSRAKYIAFREAFPLKGQLCSRIRSLFALACDNPTPIDYYINQIKLLFPQRRELYKAIIDRLADIAAADGAVSGAAERLLAAIAHGLELTPADYGAVLARHDEAIKARHVLGVPRQAEENTLKKRYRELMRYYHPDRFSGTELSPELELLLQLKSSEINEAYRRLREKVA